jgi:phosphoribosylglycinamide formyltransferase-1
MTALIEAAAADGFPAEIALVISNKADAPGLATAQANGVKTLVIESKPFGKDRAGFEVVLQAALDEHKIELICLGGFMRLFTAEFVQRWYGRMLNIHPSLLPSFPGLDPHGQALRAGVKISGATVHFVIPETDAGPIVMQGAVAVADDDTPDTLAARVLDIEHTIYPQALRLLATGGVEISGDTTRSTAGACSDDNLISPSVI